MNPERRQELIQRRASLKGQRQRELLETQRRDFVAALAKAGVVYSITADAPLIDWMTSRFKVDQWSSIEWREVKHWRHIASDISGPLAMLADLARSEDLGDPDVAILYADSGRAPLKMRYSELVKHANLILDFNWQTWAFDPDSRWVLEFHHDLGLSWGIAD